MTTPTPAIVDTLTRVLGSVYAALGALAAAAVLTDLHPAIPVTLAVAIAVVGAVQIGLRTYTAQQTTATAAVVEVREGRDVVAGPANEMVPEGSVVRAIGDGPRHRVAD